MRLGAAVSLHPPWSNQRCDRCRCAPRWHLSAHTCTHTHTHTHTHIHTLTRAWATLSAVVGMLPWDCHTMARWWSSSAHWSSDSMYTGVSHCPRRRGGFHAVGVALSGAQHVCLSRKVPWCGPPQAPFPCVYVCARPCKTWVAGTILSKAVATSTRPHYGHARRVPRAADLPTDGRTCPS